jgi:hypothetical protein
VGDEQDTDAQFGAHPVEQVQDGALHRHVQGTGRLVGDHEVGLQGQGRGDQRPLLHPAGEFVRVLGVAQLRVVDAHRLQQFDDPVPAAPTRETPTATVDAQPSPTDSPIVFTGFRELLGSCGISPIRSPRTVRHSRRERPRRLRPSSRISPDTVAVDGSRPNVAIAEVDLPDPDSPTMAVTPAPTHRQVDVGHRLDLAPAGAVGHRQVTDLQQRDVGAAAAAAAAGARAAGRRGVGAPGPIVPVHPAGPVHPFLSVSLVTHVRTPSAAPG